MVCQIPRRYSSRRVYEKEPRKIHRFVLGPEAPAIADVDVRRRLPASSDVCNRLPICTHSHQRGATRARHVHDTCTIAGHDRTTSGHHAQQPERSSTSTAVGSVTHARTHPRQLQGMYTDVCRTPVRCRPDLARWRRCSSAGHITPGRSVGFLMPGALRNSLMPYALERHPRAAAPVSRA